MYVMSVTSKKPVFLWASVLTLALAARGHGSEPQVVFQVKDGWVEFTVRHDGEPCAEATVNVLDQAGKKFAEGETGLDGQGVFPLPAGSFFIVEFKVGKRTADPVPLRRTRDGVEPSRVLLSYGLLPCCRILRPAEPKKTSAEAPAAAVADQPWPLTWILAAGGIFGLFLTLMLLVRGGEGGASHLWRVGLGGGAALAAGLVAFAFLRPTGATTSGPAPRDLAKEAREDLERRKFQPLSASLDALLADKKFEPIPTQTHPYLFQPAPAFALKDVDGKEWSLYEAIREGPILLVFYYGYHCDHCVSQLFGIDKDIERFRELGVRVLAISGDPAELTRERYKKYGAFKFPVLSDPGDKVAAEYGTFLASAKPGLEGDRMHGTFLISPRAGVVWVNRGDEPFTDNRTLLHEIARVEGRLTKTE